MIELEKTIIGWWSGGITSAVTCKAIIGIYGIDRCRFIFIDTKNEDDDTYRFKDDCAKWYGKEIETISAIGDKFNSIQEVWEKYKSLNNATGAVCSSTLKRDVRLKWEKKNTFAHQAFGFDLSEPKRVKSMAMNHKQAKPIFPLWMLGLTKEDCIKLVEDEGIEVPRAYQWGFSNNNCLGKTEDTGGCIQGGIGYWQKLQKMFPKKFAAMADMEHKLTNLKGKPVTMLKDQGKEAKANDNQLLFLKPHPDYPTVKDISMMKGREVKPLMECNGFCGTNDFERNETEEEINFNQLEMFT
jgi:hypothetical protein